MNVLANITRILPGDTVATVITSAYPCAVIVGSITLETEAPVQVGDFIEIGDNRYVVTAIDEGWTATVEAAPWES